VRGELPGQAGLGKFPGARHAGRGVQCAARAGLSDVRAGAVGPLGERDNRGG
jgi:hypothetical protein